MKKISIVLFALMWFSVSLFGEVNSSTVLDSEEIGIPIIDEKVGYIDSAAIAPDRKHFYTLKGGKITYWQMNPVKPIDSLQLDVNTATENRLQKYNIYSSQDSKRVILHSYTQIQLWDLQSKKLLKTIDEPSRVATTYKNNFITITRDNHLKTWDDKSLQLLREKNWGKKEFCNDYGDCYNMDILNMFTGKELLFINYFPYEAIFVDLNTFKIIDKLNDSQWIGKINFKRERYKYFKTYEQKYINAFPSVLWKFYIDTLFNGSFYSFISFSMHDAKDKLLADEMEIIRFHNNGDIVLQMVHSHKEKMKKAKRNRYTIYQFNDAWLVLSTRGHYFSGSKNVRKYLKIKTKDGKIVTMNDATFKKYNKTISIGEKR